jgi:gas vesicle protein
MNKDQLGGIGIGLAAGVAIGLTIGILYAPKSGKETRQIVKQKAVEIKEKAAKVVGKIKTPAKSSDENKDDD